MSKIVFKDMLSEFISLDNDLINQDNVENFSIYSWCTSTTKARTVVPNKKYIFIINIAIIMYVLMVRTLAKLFNFGRIVALSQNLLAVTPNCSTWLFYCLNGDNLHAGITSYMDFVFAKYFYFMVWLIPQNKPIGEYVERLLVEPRVRPHHPITRVFTQNLLGVFA